ncbi:6-phosphogluconolactonase [Acidisarcina polymorpha]|uniref:6-phosphogluconolactonase n=1 Tax=Acidisarcina polymorpha TaxID=2211140 RepID=A0A2Z5FYV1_9BACT|nr:lactonase family protein [Acidisarcina polymorpha]AXC12093.1 6-phosphogluconolactonase [Acidisarcina polymorpha]
MQRIAVRVLSSLLVIILSAPVMAEDMFVYFGSHGSGPHIGFSLAHFDTETGKLTEPVFLEEAVAPAYFIIRPDGRRLYTCNSFPGSSVSAYAIDPATAKLTLLNRQPSGGGDPSYVSLDPSGRYLMVANYLGGSAAVFALRHDGSIGRRTAFVQHVGASLDPNDPRHAHAHSIRFDPSHRFVLLADLGLDKIFVYRLNPKTGALTPNDPPFATVAPGSGPRHIAFDPRDRYVYAINQTANSIVGFGWDSNRGILTRFETVSTLPKGFKGENTGSEILMHPSGKFLYATNRGNNSVAVFSVQADTGRLTPVQYISTQGKTPRNADFDPTGKWLLVTNKDSNNAVVFRIDQSTGQLTQNGDPISVPAPFCERFLPAGK